MVKFRKINYTNEQNAKEHKKKSNIFYILLVI
jgi:hypothetical protein